MGLSKSVIVAGLWPVWSKSVKKQLVTITATESLSSLAEALFSQVAAPRLEKVSDPAQTITLPVELVVRDSTAPPKKSQQKEHNQ